MILIPNAFRIKRSESLACRPRWRLAGGSGDGMRSILFTKMTCNGSFPILAVASLGFGFDNGYPTEVAVLDQIFSTAFSFLVKFDL